MNKTNFGRLFSTIIDCCQHEAEEIGGFSHGNGCIRITYLPKNAWAANMLDTGICGADRFEVTSHIAEGGDYVLFRKDTTQAPIDTYAFSAMKVANCLMDQALKFGNRSGYMSGYKTEFDEEHGFAVYRGSVCYSLYYNQRPFADLIVTVSGASAATDEKVADAAAKTIKNWCAINGFTCEVPAPITPR